MRIARQLLTAALITLLLCGCGNAAERKTDKQTAAKQTTATAKGAQHRMKTYYIGRFAMDLPEEFKVEYRDQKLRLVEIDEHPNINDAEQEWKRHLNKIEQLRKPNGIKKIIIKEQPIERLGKWARGVLYYGDYMANDECKWDVMVSYGKIAALFSLSGLLDKEQSMFARVNEVARAYHPYPFDSAPDNHPFYTVHGVIELPYKRQESTYIRFAGPMEIKLEIETNETYKVEKAGVLDRLMASLAINFAPGVDVDNIRTGKRTLANIGGQEILTRGTDDTGTEVFFAWDYHGQEDSGEYPVIQIGLECPDGNIKEKIQLWDNALDSFRRVWKKR